MTSKDDIIRMAREAGFQSAEFWPDDFKGLMGCVERLVTLAQTDERNKLAAWMMQRGYATGHGDTIEDLLQELEWQIRESEREVCAKFFEDHWRETWTDEQIVEIIRARGQA